MRIWLLTAGLSLASTASAAGPSDGELALLARGIASLPRPGSSPWDVVVRRMLLDVGDRDASGELDAGEVRTVPCVLWSGIDLGVRRGWGSGLAVVYGVDPGGDWIGGDLGMASSARGGLADHLGACGLTERFGLRSGELAGVLLQVPGGGSRGWDDAVRGHLLRTLDADGDGLIDGREVDGLTCASWHVLDLAVRDRWPDGLVFTYGIASGLAWVGDAIGLGEASRRDVLGALQACDVRDANRPAPVPTTPEAIRSVVLALDDAGSAPWTRLVRALLVHALDRDDSGDLSDGDEIRAVSCTVWQGLDEALRRDGVGGLATAYGLVPDGRPWNGWSLGIAGASRAIAWDAVAACGVEDAAAPPDAVPEAPASDPRWFAPWDIDASGALDASEVTAVPCSVWQARDAASRAERGIALPARWGLRRGMAWGGAADGVTDDAERAVRGALRRCGVRDAP